MARPADAGGPRRAPHHVVPAGAPARLVRGALPRGAAGGVVAGAGRGAQRAARRPGGLRRSRRGLRRCHRLGGGRPRRPLRARRAGRRPGLLRSRACCDAPFRRTPGPGAARRGVPGPLRPPRPLPGRRPPGGSMTPLLPGKSPDTLEEADLKQYVADELERSRDRSLGLTTAVLDERDLLAQHSRLMSPLVWDLAHVGNYEDLWLLREASGVDAVRPELDNIYDAFEHPRATRPSLPLLQPSEAGDYIGLVRRKVLDSLDSLRLRGAGELLDSGFVFGMVLQHEHQHDETMLATHQLRRGDPVFPSTDALPAPAALIASAEILIPAGPFVMGTSSDSWALDNERPAHEVDLPAFFIDTVPVSNAAYRAFVEAGGYDDERLWDAAGWQWRCQSGKRSPAFWLRDGDAWLRRRFARLEPLPDAEPVQHVCWYEADAYARWAGRRLPTEVEWEKAASWDPVGEASEGAPRWRGGEASPLVGRKRARPWGDSGEHANVGQRML